MDNRYRNDINNCIKALNQSGIILYPTDTIWGIGCNALDEAAVEKVFALKCRPLIKSMIVLLADVNDLKNYIVSPLPNIISIINSFTIPTTVVYENAIGLPANVVAQDGSIAIRITTDNFCKTLIKKSGSPLLSTSANISGSPAPVIFSEIDYKIINGVDFAVNYRREDNTKAKPSRLIKINNDGKIEVIRD